MPSVVVRARLSQEQRRQLLDQARRRGEHIGQWLEQQPLPQIIQELKRAGISFRKMAVLLSCNHGEISAWSRGAKPRKESPYWILRYIARDLREITSCSPEPTVTTSEISARASDFDA